MNVWQLGMCPSLEAAHVCSWQGDLDRHQKLQQPLRIGGFDGMGEQEEEEVEAVVDLRLPWHASYPRGTAQGCSGRSGSS